MKSGGEEVILSLDRLADIDVKALKKLLRGIKKYPGRVKIVCQERAEAVRAAISSLPQDLTALFVEIVPEPVQA